MPHMRSIQPTRSPEGIPPGDTRTPLSSECLTGGASSAGQGRPTSSRGLRPTRRPPQTRRKSACPRTKDRGSETTAPDLWLQRGHVSGASRLGEQKKTKRRKEEGE
eukprot:3828874-Pyramimonas_sp.AAC.1